MDPEIEKIIKEQMEKLPTEIRDLFVDQKINNKIIHIGTKHGLNVEQMGNLQIEIYLVMLGLVHPDEFPDDLKNSLQINNDKVDEIIHDINFDILDVIRGKLKKVYEETNEEEPEAPQPDIMSSAGIEIIDKENLTKEEKEELEETLPVTEKLEIAGAPEISETEIEKEVTKPETASILAQKISSSVKTPAAKTEYSLNNLSKPAPTSYPPKGDPYRLSPEE